MEEERAFLLDKLRRLEARLREVERLGDRLREIQELEGRREDTKEVFDVLRELRRSFSMVEASSWSSDSESDQPSEDKSDDLLPPPDAFEDPDPAVTGILETECMSKELPYRPALKKQFLWEQLEARQEGMKELFAEVVLSFNMRKASVSSSDSEANQSSDDGDDLLLPPPDAFADPDSAATCMLEMGRMREELPYRPALSLRKPPACFPHPVFRQSLGGSARDSSWERHFEPALPLLPCDIGGVGTGRPTGERQPKAEHLPSDSFRPLSLSWSGAWDNWPVLPDVWGPVDEPADPRRWPRTGAVETGWGPPRVETSLPRDSPAVLWRWGGEPPDHGMDDRRPCSPADVGWTTT
jgi:hypothetical protein